MSPLLNPVSNIAAAFSIDIIKSFIFSRVPTGRSTSLFSWEPSRESVVGDLPTPPVSKQAKWGSVLRINMRGSVVHKKVSRLRKIEENIHVESQNKWNRLSEQFNQWEKKWLCEYLTKKIKKGQEWKVGKVCKALFFPLQSHKQLQQCQMSRSILKVQRVANITIEFDLIQKTNCVGENIEFTYRYPTPQATDWIYWQ